MAKAGRVRVQGQRGYRAEVTFPFQDVLAGLGPSGPYPLTETGLGDLLLCESALHSDRTSLQVEGAAASRPLSLLTANRIDGQLGEWRIRCRS